MTGLFFNLYCDKCRTYRLHKVIEGNPVVNISCCTCGKTRTEHIVNTHVKVERGFWDNYVRDKGIKPGK